MVKCPQPHTCVHYNTYYKKILKPKWMEYSQMKKESQKNNMS